MTTAELIEQLGKFSGQLLLAFFAIPLFCLLYGKVLGRDRGAQAPHKYVYAVLIYATCIPGILSSVITAYGLFFIKQNLLEVNYVVYFVPIISMIASVGIISRFVDLDDVPGFDRLRGLFFMLAAAMILALGIQKTRIWLFFGGSIMTLFVLILLLFVAMKWGSHLLFRKREQ